MAEVVYVVGAAGSSRVKIGRTKDPESRLAGIQRMSPIPLEIRWQEDGGCALETRLHRRFKSLRAHGEWFDFGDLDPVAEVKAAVCAIKAEADAREPMHRSGQRPEFTAGSPAGDVVDALDCLAADPDPLSRWADAGEMTGAVRGAIPRVARVRSGVVRELRDGGMTYRAIGDLLGVHFTRVKQLADGDATRWKSGDQAAKPESDEGGED